MKWLCQLCLLTVLVWIGVAQPAGNGAARRVIYFTGFEVTEGYPAASENTDLVGQVDWVGDGSGGNGILTNFFEGEGQQAYAGFNPPAAPKDVFLNLWRPLDVATPAPGDSVIRFAVLMQIVDSTNKQYDDFRWSAYNTAGQRLFTLNFDNYTADIGYALDTGGFVSSGFKFSNDAMYELEIFMNFARTNWTALLNGVVVVDSQPLTTTGLKLDLSDVDAVWALHQAGSAGDNYLIFDNYEIDAEPGATIPSLLELVGRDAQGQFSLMLHGERNMAYAIEVTDDFSAGWTPLATNRLATGLWNFTDTTATNYARSFYRAREVRP